MARNRTLTQLSIVFFFVGLSTQAAPRDHPIILKDSTGDTLQVDRTGPNRLDAAVNQAMDIQKLDGEIAIEKRKGWQKVDPKKIALAEEFRDVAQYKLGEGLYISNNTSGAGLPGAQRESAQTFSQTSREVLSKPWIHDKVLTNIKTTQNRPIVFVSFLEYKSRGSGVELNWAPYSDGQRMDVHAYVFRIHDGTTTCDVFVPVWADPTSQVLSCPTN